MIREWFRGLATVICGACIGLAGFGFVVTMLAIAVGCALAVAGEALP